MLLMLVVALVIHSRHTLLLAPVLALVRVLVLAGAHGHTYVQVLMIKALVYEQSVNICGLWFADGRRFLFCENC